jgi:hypothetical protein
VEVEVILGQVRKNRSIECDLIRTGLAKRD